MAVVTEEQAKLIRDELLKVVKKHFLWYTELEKHEPNLKLIEIGVSIRIGGNKQ